MSIALGIYQVSHSSGVLCVLRGVFGDEPIFITELPKYLHTLSAEAFNAPVGAISRSRCIPLIF